MRKLFSGAALLALLAACNAPEADKPAAEKTANMDSVKTAIAAANTAFGEAAARGDSAAIAAIYHSQAQVYPPEMAATDKSGMGAMTRQLPAMGVKKFTLTTNEVLNGGEYMIENGTYAFGDSTNTFDKGKYIAVWKEEDGKWKLYRDMWNSNAPPAPRK